MTKARDPEALLSAYLADGMEILPDRVVDAVLAEAHRTRQRAVFGPWRTRSMLRTTLAAAAVVAVVAVGGAFFVIQRDLPVVAGPSPTPIADPSLPGVVAPSSSPSGTAPNPSPVPSSAGVWIATGTMGTPRSGHTAVRLLDGRVLVAGGGDETSAELYDPVTGTWSATGNMLKPHVGLAATLLRDGRVLVFGEDANPEVYDPASGTWTATVRMVWGDGETGTMLRDGKVLVRGDGGSELYDPDTGTWTATRSKGAQRHSHAAILLPDGKVLVAGGHVAIDNPTDSAELYDPDTGSWTAIANMHAKREIIEAFLQPDGKVLVVGGSNRGDPQSAELYDPATRAWTATGGVSLGGAGETLTLLADGRVLMAGAGNGHDAAELYDPSTGAWTTAAPMLRSPGTPAILLLDGTVLVAGGNDCLDGVCVATGSAELYVPAGVSPPPLPAFPSPPPTVFPSPTPRPTPVPPGAGPLPPNARPWKVTVVNHSADPATLFAAEEGESGVARLCGSVTPNVVPAGVTMKVTFQLPTKSVTSCWIWLNPVPGEGGSMFQTSDAPMPGNFVITAHGQVAWLGQ